MPVCTEKEAYTQVYSQGPVRVIWSVCTEKEAYTQVYSQRPVRVIWSVCTEKEAYTQVYSQGDMECLSVLRRKPTHRCTVMVTWSVCLY